MVKFEIESNELSINDQILLWDTERPCDFANEFQWNGFNMIKYSLTNDNSSYTHTGNFSRITAKFFLRRQFIQLLLDVYVPIYLFVIISWCSFWIEISASPARVTLGVTILLTMLTAIRVAREKLPPLSYIHALDVWFLICIIFVFASIIEYTIVHFTNFQCKKRQTLINNNNNNQQLSNRNAKCSIDNATAAGITFSHSLIIHKLMKFNLANAHKIDKICRLLFPMLFLLINCLYWIILYSMSKNIEVHL